MLERACCKILMTALVLAATGSAASETGPQAENHIKVRGVVRSPDGAPVKNVEVCWHYMSSTGSSYSGGEQVTDAQGCYTFEVSAGRRHYVAVGGKTATSSRSPWFPTKSGTDVSVEDLIVRPYSASIKGRVVFENGQPAANLTYGCGSENCFPLDSYKPPRTGSGGQFVIERLLPDEPYSFWVFVEKNVYCVWKRLDPGVSPLQLTLRKSDCVTLPEDYLGYGTHETIATSMVYAKDSKIDFKLPDLDGRTVSLSEIRASNKAVVVTITGTWCGGCRLETPYLVEFYNRYRSEGLEIVGIAFEAPSNREPLDTIRSFKQEYNINYTVLYGGPASRERVGLVVKGLHHFWGYPTTIYIDRDGKVQFIHTGFWIHSEPHKKWQLDQMESHIRSILSSGGGAADDSASP